MLPKNIVLLFHKCLIFIWSYMICLPWYRIMHIQICLIYSYNLGKAEFCFMVLPGIEEGKSSTYYVQRKILSTLKTILYFIVLASSWSYLFIHLELEFLTQTLLLSQSSLLLAVRDAETYLRTSDIHFCIVHTLLLLYFNHFAKKHFGQRHINQWQKPQIGDQNGKKSAN